MIYDLRLKSVRRGAKRTGFTLIELLVVIAIMATLAGFTLVVVKGLSKTKNIKIATAELGQIETALEGYKSKYGVYPPGNANPTGTYSYPPLTNSLLPQLYYELTGVTNNSVNYVTLDNAAQIPQASVNSAYGVGGFINCSKGSGEDATPAKNFIGGLRQNQIASVQNNGIAVSNIVTSVRGPDTSYKPLGIADVNPFRYVYPGVNNPNGYDLWVKLSIGGKTYLVCNWSSVPIVNSPLP